MRDALQPVLASANVLFQQPAEGGALTHVSVHPQFMENYLCCLVAMRSELRSIEDDGSAARHYWEVVSETPDATDYLNALIAYAGARPVSEMLSECLWDVIRQRLPEGEDDNAAASDPQLAHVLHHALRFARQGVEALRLYVECLREVATAMPRDAIPRPGAALLGSLEEDAGYLATMETGLEPGLVTGLRERIKSRDAFSASRTFRPVHNEIRPGALGDIRSLKNFYGYVAEQEFFLKHFGGFVQGDSVAPLLLTSLPGMGKTHLTIATALSFPEVTLINAGSESLEGPLEPLIATLGAHHYRRFVLFFDDVDPEPINWSTFRNQVEGYLPYADNVAMVIATNGEFSTRVTSRCACFAFRPMSSEVCQEFISDYLDEYRWMSQPYPNLVSTVAADFASMYKRGVLSDLTPRSLIRYFEMLEGDKEKIKGLIRESLGEIVRVPMEEAFYTSNKQIRDRLENERRERLGLPPKDSQPELRPLFGGQDLPKQKEQ